MSNYFVEDLFWIIVPSWQNDVGIRSKEILLHLKKEKGEREKENENGRERKKEREKMRMRMEEKEKRRDIGEIQGEKESSPSIHCCF